MQLLEGNVGPIRALDARRWTVTRCPLRRALPFSCWVPGDSRALKHPSGKQGILGPLAAHEGGDASPWAAPALPGGWHSRLGP